MARVMSDRSVPSVLFVCMGNICRSPAAECVLKHQLSTAGKDEQLFCDSAGTLGYHAGEPPDERMQHTLRKRQIPVVGRARKVVPADLDRFDLILAMDKQNLQFLLDLQKKTRRHSQNPTVWRVFGYATRR